MKGYVNVERADLLAAIIGFEFRYTAAKETRDKGIQLYYDKHYVNGSTFTRWWNRKKTPSQFVRTRMCAFGTWTDALRDVLTPEECEEVDWWCWTHKTEPEPLRALYKASDVGVKVLIDDRMARYVNQYKNYLENEV